ncbi:MAG: cysteine--tRNA ligase [Pseudomonadota bacterium]
MGLRIYNTYTRGKESFEPLVPGKVGMYVCGVTVYDMCHIGHARSIVTFDVMYRYLRHRGYDVTYVRNFTDVDDKIINRAAKVGEDWKSLAERYIREFHTDTDALGVLRPNIEPKATEHIDDILSLIADLIDRGYAYEADGDVMFSVEKFDGYGRLSGKKTDELISGARVEVDEKKRNPLDFALWKAAKPGEPSWPSPWGPGRPGWHIECSAMSMRYLGESFDIHGGGADLAFPHHENEIAQSSAATGKPFAKYWVHNGFVNIRSEKMSKSLGNVLNIRDVTAEVPREVLRLFLLSTHYRSPLDYIEKSVEDAGVGLERLYSALHVLDSLVLMGGTSNNVPIELKGLADRFTEAMDDDFNSPKAVAVLFDAARAINRLTEGGRPKKKALPKPEILTASRAQIVDFSREVLGILTEEPANYLTDIRVKKAAALGISAEDIEALISERGEARKNRDFQRSDQIRADLDQKGIVLEDGPDGTSWKVR